VESIDKAISELKGKEHNDIETYLHDKVYDRIFATDKRLYELEDIAESGGADNNVIVNIKEQKRIQKALL
jgi:hypothetical protein